MFSCNLYLVPTDWCQNVEHYSSINVEGRRFIANCKIEPGSELELSNMVRLASLPAQLQIFEATRMRDRLAKLPSGALGELSFHEAEPVRADFPASEACLAGWFVLNPQSLQDVWDQVRQGGYSDCNISVDIGPVESPKVGWLWDVRKTPRLVIDTVSITFKRAAPTHGEFTRSPPLRRR
jgi:hypothetical protein